MRRRSLLRAWPWPLYLPLGLVQGHVAHAQTVNAQPPDAVRRGRPLLFPRDHGAHPSARIEWWYVTGWLGLEAAKPTLGFQLTFFRRATGADTASTSRFAARHLLMLHAAVTDVAAGTHRHAQQLARWSGVEDASLRDRASMKDADLAMGPSFLRRTQAGTTDVAWLARINGAGESHAPGAWSLDLMMRPTQAVLLQGDAGFSRKGPDESQASHYYSLPQLQVQARWSPRRVATSGGKHSPGAAELGASTQSLEGLAWLDHEWSDALMHPDSVGWDWIGINLDDGSALTAFRLRRADGSVSWAGGSFRAAQQPARIFLPSEVHFEPGRAWTSPSTGASYPVTWRLRCPAGVFEVRSVLDAQELDARTSTGTVYWEGLASLHDVAGGAGAGSPRVGWGYLEMTGYAAPLRW